MSKSGSALALLGLLAALFVATAANAGEPLRIIYVNGIQNTFADALESGVRIREVLDSSQNHALTKRTFSVEVAYNPVGFTATGKVSCVLCHIDDDQKELFVQKTAEEKYFADFASILAPHNASTIIDRAAATRVKLGHVDDLTPGDNSLEANGSVTDAKMAPNSAVIAKLLNAIKANSGRAIVVAHSQGNLLANLAYASLASEFGQATRQMLRVVNVANTTRLSISGLNLTHANDAALFSTKILVGNDTVDPSLEKLPSENDWTRTTPACTNSDCDFLISAASFGGAPSAPGVLRHAFAKTYLSEAELPTVKVEQGVTFTAGRTRFVDRFEDLVYAAATSLDTENQPPPPNSKGQLDTGIGSDHCFLAGASTLVSCLGLEALALNAQQDGMIGRDATSPDPLNGKLGFDYVKLDSNGQELPMDSVFWDCVRDRVTGHVWEHKNFFDPTHLRHDNRRYTNHGDGRAGDASKFVADVNSVGLCGFSDWRLPTARELQGIVDYGRPLIGTFGVDYFLYASAPASGGTSWWSGEASALAGRSFMVAFHGAIGAGLRSEGHPVRLVRGSSTPSQFVISADGREVTDTSTGLIWQRCLDGLTWDATQNGCAGQGLPVYEHQWALERARDSGGWRLPSIKELTTLATAWGANSVVDESVFPGFADFPNIHIGIWSSTPYLGNTSQAWVFQPAIGTTFPWNRTNFGGVGAPGYPIRLVRDGTP